MKKTSKKKTAKSKKKVKAQKKRRKAPKTKKFKTPQEKLKAFQKAREKITERENDVLLQSLLEAPKASLHLFPSEG